MARKIIGISGFIGSGKGTVGDILIETYGFKKLSFADRLKDAAAVLYDWPRHLLEGDTKESRDWRETPDEFWSKELGKNITPRLVLQLLGTDCMRHGFDNNIWVLIVKQQILNNPDTDFVLPDVRFYNERDMIRDLGGTTWQVRRGEMPEWVDKAISDNRYDTNWMSDYSEIHESEWRWIDYDQEFGAVINNNGTLDDLKSTVKRLIESY